MIKPRIEIQVRQFQDKINIQPIVFPVFYFNRVVSKSIKKNQISFKKRSGTSCLFFEQMEKRNLPQMKNKELRMDSWDLLRHNFGIQINRG